MKLLLLCIVALLIQGNFCYSQETKTDVANPKFKTNGGRTFWMGKNYRTEWKTPITVPVLNMSTEKGGLKPVKLGGGKQTRSLRLEDPTGRQYALRSIKKFITSKTLPADLQSEAAVDLVADGVSASYPFAALSLPILAEAAGVPFLKVKLVYVPDDPLLGEFREDFKNMLAYLEERIPENVSKSWSSEEVADDLKDDNDNRVDQLGLLRARILDMFVMDLDRHEDQWEWGAREQDKGKMYFPIPKDRDQAFYVNEGVLPTIASWPWLVPQLEGLKADARNINRFNFAARNLDRFFLNELEEEDWRREVDNFLPKMTDAVIERAMAQQPPEIHGLRLNEITQILKDRRQFLADEVMTYYRFLALNVNVVASDKTELFDVMLNDDGSALLQVFKITKEGEQSSKMYERKFDPAVTDELRLYGMGGDDKFVLNGKNDKIKIRLIGGPGLDEFTNSTSTGETAIIYDQKSEDNKITGQFKEKLTNDTIAHYYDRLSYKYNQVIPFISAAFNRDDGLFLGFSLKIIKHGFRKDPYKNLHEFAINHALSSKSLNLRYYSEYISVFSRNSDLLFEVDVNAPKVINFFGYGENSVYNKLSPGSYKFYRARFTLADASLLLRHNFSKKVIMTLGPTFQVFSLDSADKFNVVRNIVLNAPNSDLDPATLFQNQTYFGGKFTFNVDTRNNAVLPTSGIIWENMVRYLTGRNDASYENVTQFNSAFTFFLALIKNRLILADRVGAGHTAGDFEFYQAQYLGSEDNLRGYRKHRFAGRSKFYNNADLRLRISNFKTYLFDGAWGLLGFVDAGRIWADGSGNSKWLTGYGGGLWFSPLRRMVLTFSYAASKEDKLPLIGLGWKF